MKIRILFVCLGNICRSPAAEGVLKGFVEDAEMDDILEVDSAGTSGGHSGSKADARMRRAASKRGYELTSRSRQVTARDFEDFDLILAMDDDNYRTLRSLAPDEVSRNKVRHFTNFGSRKYPDHVPDPYYGGESGFEHVLDILEDCCKGLIEHLGKQ